VVSFNHVVEIYSKPECESEQLIVSILLSKKIDNRILNVAIDFTKKFSSQKTIIISKNINLRLKAEAIGIAAEDYEEGRYSKLKKYKGYY
jgi:PhoH-like ATPase